MRTDTVPPGGAEPGTREKGNELCPQPPHQSHVYKVRGWEGVIMDCKIINPESQAFFHMNWQDAPVLRRFQET